MGQPVKLSDELVQDAREIGDVSQRSIAGQIEYWARLGRAAERSLRAEEALRLKQRGDVRPLSECLRSVATPQGQGQLQRYLAARPFPHFEAAPNAPGLLVRIDEDGTRTVGRFVNREFRPVAK